MARRNRDQARAGLWELPGGKVEPGEEDHTALRRELREELACDVSVGPLLGEVVHAYPDVTIHLLAYRCSLTHQTPQALEHAELRWLPHDALGSVDWAPADRELIAQMSVTLTGPAVE